MPSHTFREQELARAKARLEARIADRPAQIESGISKTREGLIASDLTREQELKNILTGAGARFGIAGTPEAGRSAVTEQRPEFERERTTALSFRRMQEMNQFFNDRFNYAYDQYLNAGYNLQESQNFARQWALQQTQQKFQAEIAEKGRQDALEKEQISEEFSDKGLALEEEFESRQNPYLDAALRGLIGLAPYGIYAGYLGRGRKGKAVPESLQQRASGLGFGGTSGTFRDQFERFKPQKPRLPYRTGFRGFSAEL